MQIFQVCGPDLKVKQPVSKLASILLGELVAIKITLDFILEEKTRRQSDPVMIFSDSQTSVGILQLDGKARHTRRLAVTSSR